MNNQNLIIYEFTPLFDILNEIKDQLSFNLLNVSKKEFSKLKIDEIENYLIFTKKKEIVNLESQIFIDNYPLKLSKLIETINVNFLKKKFKNQSEVDLGLYKLNLNSRKIFNLDKILGLTEKEIDIILFLKKSKKPVTINNLQIEVWGHQSKLETHTVETHIYRLRKKISSTFGDNEFIKSSKFGYIIK